MNGKTYSKTNFNLFLRYPEGTFSCADAIRQRVLQGIADKKQGSDRHILTSEDVWLPPNFAQTVKDYRYFNGSLKSKSWGDARRLFSWLTERYIDLRLFGGAFVDKHGLQPKPQLLTPVMPVVVIGEPYGSELQNVVVFWNGCYAEENGVSEEDMVLFLEQLKEGSLSMEIMQ